MNILLSLFLLPALLYLAAWWADIAGGRPWHTRALVGAALVCHAATFVLPWQGGHFHYGFGKLVSVTVWLGILLMWLEGLRLDVRGLLRLGLPIAVVASVLPGLFPGGLFAFDDPRPLFLPHLVVGTLAYGVMFLASLHALLMALLERGLHAPRQPRSAWMRQLVAAEGPQVPLLVLERLLYRHITLGFLLLLVTTLTGFVFSHETFGRPLQMEHKTVFSLVATVLFGVLLLGRRIWGWRGRAALRVAFGGFLLLLLSYVGSRFVLEVLLHRV